LCAHSSRDSAGRRELPSTCFARPDVAAGVVRVNGCPATMVGARRLQTVALLKLERWMVPRFYEPNGSLRRHVAVRYLIADTPKRDLRVDFVRGLALWMIFVNHAPSNALGNFTLYRVALFDGADVFVFLSGYAAGLVYGRAMDREGWGLAVGAALRRAWVVYAAHVMTFLLLVALVGRFGRSTHFEMMRLAPLVAQPLEALWQVLLLRFQPKNVDILPIYVALLALLAAVLPLLRRPALLLALAVACWAPVWFARLDLPTWPSGGWYLNPLAWQLLFLTGAALGYVPPSGTPRSVPWNRWLLLACIVLLVSLRPLYLLRGASDLLTALPDWLSDAVLALPERGQGDKTFQHPLRVLSVLALAYVAGHLMPREAGWLRRRCAAPFVLMGQRSLPVFCATVAGSFIAQRLIEVGGGGWVVQAEVNLGGLALLFAVAVAASRIKVLRSPTYAMPAAAGPGAKGTLRYSSSTGA